MKNNEIKIKSITKKKFDAYVLHTRNPIISDIAEELEWYSTEDETILGVILLDLIDKDFSAVALGPDESGKYRAFNLKASMATPEEARTWIISVLQWRVSLEQKVFNQGDEKAGINLFKELAPVEKQHPYFVHLNRDKQFSPAKEMIQKLMPHYYDIDGNFVEQFQTTGFDSRLWELYLNTYLAEEGLFNRRSFNAPDFVVENFEETVCIEAVIVGRKKENPARFITTGFPTIDPAEELKDKMPIRFGSPLYTKLKKEYWKLEHVKGKPLVFAIADFHDDQSMLWSNTALTTYLYGYRYKHFYDESGKLIIEAEKIDSHIDGEKTIPSGFFDQPDTENVSAILFSASATLSKFNRIGKQCGFGDPSVNLVRTGVYHDHNPNASEPLRFHYEVDENSTETWSEGLSFYHNPKAKFPLNPNLFPNAAHHFFDDGQIISTLPDFHPYFSMTFNITPYD